MEYTMPRLLNCQVERQHFAMWEKHFTQRYAPFFLTDAVCALLPPHIVRYTRAEMGENFIDLPLDARDAYAIYRVDRAAGWCALLDAAQLASFDSQLRTILFREQQRLGRGHVYALADAQRLCENAMPALSSLGQWSFVAQQGTFVLLDHALWQSFGATMREGWLRWFVAQEQRDCLSATITEQEWAQMPNGAWLRRLAGTFATKSGPNCFATTLAALLPGNAGIAECWLHQGPFERGLAQLGMHAEQIPDELDAIPVGAVLVWQDAQGSMKHACFVCAPGLALNKDSQAWFVPRQIVPLKYVVDVWQADALEIKMYSSV
jgi:hypothetical protein